MKTDDLYPMTPFWIMTGFVAALILVLIACFVIYLVPKFRIWREMAAIARRDAMRRKFEAERLVRERWESATRAPRSFGPFDERPRRDLSREPHSRGPIEDFLFYEDLH